MADKNFGVRKVELTGSSGTPNITSPTNLNLNANTVAISTDVTVGGEITSNVIVSAGQSVGIGSTQPTSALDVKGTFSAENYNISGIVTAQSLDAAISRWNVTADGSSHYNFAGPGLDGTEDDPTIYLVRGQEYIFNLDGLNGQHPFEIRVSDGGSAYNDGITNNSGTSGNLIWDVQQDAPRDLVYQCTAHSDMLGDIVILNSASTDAIGGIASVTNLSVSGVSTLLDGGGGEIKIHESAGDPIVEKSGGGTLIVKTNNGVDINKNTQRIARLGDGASGGASLFHSGSQKFATSSSGVSITGGVSATGVSTFPTLDVTGDVSATNGTFSGDVSIGGTLTYEDVTNIDSVGIITAQSGVSIADSIFHTGDTNTAIRFPAADTFTVETGGSEALRVTSDGVMLLGTDTTSNTAASAIFQSSPATSAANLALTSDSATPADGDQLGNVAFADANHSQSAYIGARRDGGTWTTGVSQPTSLVFVTTPDGTKNFVRRMTIRGNGNIGIGETLPITRLHINSGTTDLAGIVESSDANVFLSFKDGNSSGNQQVQIGAVTNDLVAYAGGNERLRITSDAKVGINTDMGGAPASLYPFSVYRSTGTGYVYTETAQSGASAGLRAKAGTADFTIFTTQGTGQLAVYDNTNSAERLRITSAGLIGIGTDSPAGDLQISGSGDRSLLITGGTSGTTSVQMGDSLDADAGAILYDNSNNSMQFKTNTSERLRIDSSGNIGIGSQSPAQTLDIMSANPVIRLTDTDPSGVYSQIDGAGGDLILAADGGAGSSNSFISLRVDGTDANAEKLRIDSSGKISTGGESSPDVSGGGLCLDQNAEDGAILTLKSSDIAHGMTTLDETDTYFSVRKVSGDKGGARIRAYTDAAGGDPAVLVSAYINSDTDQSYVPITLLGGKKDGTGTQNIAANRRIVEVKNSDGTRIASFTGTGLVFGNDSGTANALDDYEEGDWVPAAFNGANGASTTSVTSREARYVKVGGLVHISCYITIAKGTNTSQSFEIYGLPFTVGSDHGLHSGINVGYIQGFNTSVSMVQATAQPSSSRILVRALTGTSDTISSTLDANSLNSSMEIILGGTYYTKQ